MELPIATAQMDAIPGQAKKSQNTETPNLKGQRCN